MRFREHILYLVTARDIPFRNAVGTHFLLHCAPFLCGNLALCDKTLTHRFGYLEGFALFKTLMY